jgi:hypothetical protein
VALLAVLLVGTPLAECIRRARSDAARDLERAVRRGIAAGSARG